MEEHKDPNYIAVFVWLGILTVAEIATTRLPLAHTLIGILLVGMALTKAALVALFFMHLRFERTTLGVIAVTPLCLCVLLVFALLPDSSAVDHHTANRPAVVSLHE
jgi:cytochrome c oxidase subunit IV